MKFALREAPRPNRRRCNDSAAAEAPNGVQYQREEALLATGEPMRGVFIMLVSLLVAVPVGAADMSALVTIKWQMIVQSALIYKQERYGHAGETDTGAGNCPCPYSLKEGNVSLAARRARGVGRARANTTI